jgi:class I fructose-bisphosphate aldolase
MGTLLRDDGRALVVAMDHTLAAGLLPGWEQPSASLSTVLDGGPDAILTTFGILKRFGPEIRGRTRTVLRLDGGMTSYLEAWGEYTDWRLLYSVEDALRLGADAVIVNAFIGGAVELDTAEIIAATASACLHLGLPLVVEALPARGPRIQSVTDPSAVASAVRIAAELGADLIKTYYTGTPESFHTAVSCCPVPVLIAGGEKMDSDRAVLEMVAHSLEAGGAGVFFGRNVWQHAAPGRMVRALRALIHDGSNVEWALQLLSGA